MFAQGWAKRGTVSLPGHRQRRKADTACNNRDVESERKSKSRCRQTKTLRHWREKKRQSVQTNKDESLAGGGEGVKSLL